MPWDPDGAPSAVPEDRHQECPEACILQGGGTLIPVPLGWGVYQLVQKSMPLFEGQ